MNQHGWRPMIARDVGSVSFISDRVHGRYTERAEVYAERLGLYPAGCFLFERGGDAAGYLIGHPWRREGSVPLNSLIGAIPSEADCFYLHDLALLPSARGTGAGRSGTDIAIAVARAGGFAEIRLVAVSGAESFWTTQGFAEVVGEASAGGSYGDEAVYMRRSLRS